MKIKFLIINFIKKKKEKRKMETKRGKVFVLGLTALEAERAAGICIFIRGLFILLRKEEGEGRREKGEGGGEGTGMGNLLLCECSANAKP